MKPNPRSHAPGARAWIALAAIAALAVAAACARQAVPAVLDPANTACQHCRMAVSDVHFAAQIAVPGVESQFFDDISCLVNYLRQDTTTLPSGAVAFVADHRTGEWVRASAAVFSKSAGFSTPMGGGIVAHVSEESRRQDSGAAGGTPMTAAEVFGPAGPPNGGLP